ncbi:MAG: hypothetical protein GY795_14475 [Desulfobacterales bacterium]|nr:hypothetical protein [Desulfobacterales bacterium]
MDYGKNWQKLEQNPNPFAVVVMAHLKARQIKDDRERKRWKLRLIRMLYERGYGKKHILELFRFIDWLLVLPEKLEIQFQEELTHMTEENEMPYVTSIERIAEKKGFEAATILTFVILKGKYAYAQFQRMYACQT